MCVIIVNVYLLVRIKLSVRSTYYLKPCVTIDVIHLLTEYTLDDTAD